MLIVSIEYTVCKCHPNLLFFLFVCFVFCLFAVVFLTDIMLLMHRRGNKQSKRTHDMYTYTVNTQFASNRISPTMKHWHTINQVLSSFN